MRAWLELAKPRVTVMVALTAAAGYRLAAGPSWDGAGMAWCVLGVALASAATGCLNQVMEAEFDVLMKRTRARPLPSGRVAAAPAAALGLAWAAAGLGLLAWKSGLLAFALTAFTFLSYLLAYTPLKRRWTGALWVGAVPGALPPVIGWAAGGGGLDSGAAALFALQFFWQLPHFLALAWMYREDYARAGFVLAAQDPSGVETAWQIGASSAGLVLASLIPYLSGRAGPGYLAGALLLGLAVLAAGLKPFRDPIGRNARQVFGASLLYLPAAYALLICAWR